MPRSSWQWVLMTAWPMFGTRSLSVRITVGVLGGRGVADGVGDVHGGRAGLDGGLDDLAEEVELGPRGVLGAELDVGAVALARRTLATARSMICAVVIRSLCSRWMAEVARKTWIRGFWANLTRLPGAVDVAVVAPGQAADDRAR